MKIDVCDMILILYGIITTLYSISLYVKRNKPKNNVRFFVKAVRDDMYWLYMKDKKGNISFIGLDEDCNNLWGLNPDDFTDMKKGEIREVFINLEG